MPSLMPIIIGIGFAGVGFVLMLVGLRFAQGDEVSQRLQDFVHEPAPPSERLNRLDAVRRRELTGSFRTRILQPWLRAVAGLLGRFMPARNIGRIEHLLSVAGRPLGLGAREFFGIRLIFMVLGLWLSIRLASQGTDLIYLFAAGLALYIGVMGPSVWLKRAVRKRQDRIRKDLPDALDMLSVCAQAGLGFDQSIQRVSDEWDSLLSKEFGRMSAEMEMGVPRRQALRNMADRLEITELSSFVAVIIQSDQLGMSIADTLQSQAQQMRIERRFRVQEAARKLPLKMLFPMILLIFPAMLAVVCGPSIPLIFELFDTIRPGP